MVMANVETRRNILKKRAQHTNTLSTCMRSSATIGDYFESTVEEGHRIKFEIARSRALWLRVEAPGGLCPLESIQV